MPPNVRSHVWRCLLVVSLGYAALQGGGCSTTKGADPSLCSPPCAQGENCCNRAQVVTRRDGGVPPVPDGGHLPGETFTACMHATATGEGVIANGQYAECTDPG
jgi:hypothetical protein